MVFIFMGACPFLGLLHMKNQPHGFHLFVGHGFIDYIDLIIFVGHIDIIENIVLKLYLILIQFYEASIFS